MNQDSHITVCDRCGNECDEEVCWCGDERQYHHIGSGHNFVPMGCTCGYSTQETKAVYQKETPNEHKSQTD